MSDEARVAIKKEFIIGTAPDAELGAGLAGDMARAVPPDASHDQQTIESKHHDEHDEVPVPPIAPPAIATVGDVVSRLSRLVLVSPSASDEADFALLPLAADELDRIVDVCELIEQVYSWAVEEGTTFVEEPSQLAEVGAPHVVVACLWSERPRVLAASLRVVRECLRHPQSRSELLREAALRGGHVTRDDEAGTASTRQHAAAVVLTRQLGALLARHGGAVNVVVAVLAVATALMPLPGAAESALRDGLVSDLLRLTDTLAQHSAVDVAVANLFAAIADVPFCAVDGDAENVEAMMVVPTTVLLTHVGVVLPTLVALARRSANNLMVKQAVCRVFLECARHPENRSRLLEVGAYAVVVECLRSSLRVPALFGVCAEMVGYCIPLLDALQVRRLIRILRDALLLTGELALQLLVLALLVALARAAVSAPSGLAPAGGGGGGGAFAAYQLYPMPPTEAIVPSHRSSTTTTSTTTRTTKLTASDVLFAPPDKATDALETMRALSLPQLVAHVVDFYAQHDGADIDENEAQKVRQVRRLAEQCLVCLSRPF